MKGVEEETKAKLDAIHQEALYGFRPQGSRFKTQVKIAACLEAGAGHDALFGLFERRLGKLVGNGIPE
eukprot:5759184-Karenia_brevis.AAC.1